MSTVTYMQDGIKVTRISKPFQTSNYMHHVHPGHQAHFAKKEEDNTLESKESEYKMRHSFFKYLKNGDADRCEKLYKISKHNTKIGSKIFEPKVDDYCVSLSNFYTWTNGEVTDINTWAFKVCFLSHRSYWELYKDRPITYIYASQSEIDTVRRLGKHDLMAFIQQENIRQTLPGSYYKCYCSEDGTDTPPLQNKYVVLREFGTPKTTNYPTIIRSEMKMPEHTVVSYKKRTTTDTTKTSKSTYSLFSDSSESMHSEDDKTDEKDTAELFAKHQAMLQQNYGKTSSHIDTAIAKIA